MAGVKGRSGGGREGSGPKPPYKSITIKLGDFLLINHQVDGVGMIEGGTVTFIGKREFAVTLKDKENEIVKVLR